MRQSNSGHSGGGSATDNGLGGPATGRPLSWTTTAAWSVPHAVNHTDHTNTTIISTTNNTPPTTTTPPLNNGTSKLITSNSDRLIESCEEEYANSSTDDTSDSTNNFNNINSERGNSASSSTNTIVNNNINKRLKAKISLDESRLRTINSDYCSLDNDNFTRSDAITRTLGLEKLSSSSSSNSRQVVTHKTALARSSSYQALHSALARLYRLDDFITERLGQGFFSEVFKACHRVTGEVMVLKMNKLPSNRHNMLREVELMNRLHHDNILAYHGVCINEGQVHALTEYINGGSLDAMLQDRSVDISWFERVSLAADTSRGMAYLHKQGVFHRDLTSKNILIKESVFGGRRRREAVVADFGLAAPIPKDKTVRMRQVGSPYWMAPEVIRGVWYDHRADVFSCGIILCEMIARCEADPDVLPRTNNFGVHYLAFSKMCQNDTPPYFLQMAFQCCQIDPGTRPNFDVLTKNFESLLNRLIGHRGSSANRKQKVCHRRSLSDDCLMFGRSTSSSEDNSSSGGSGGSTGQGSAAHAPPANTGAPASFGRTPQEVVERMGAADPYFTPSTATVNPFTRVKLPAPSRLTVQDGARFCHSLPDPLPGHRQMASHSSDRDRHQYHQEHNGSSSSSSRRHHHGSHCSLAAPDAGPRLGFQRHEPGVGHGGPHLGGAVKRRGSGESGFFSVGDMDRTGTPELWLSYSELSCASLAWEDESWVTDSSEDLPPPCAVGGQEETRTQDTDIKAIVEFFERGYGSLKAGPLIGPRSSRLSPRSPASLPHCHLWGATRPSPKPGVRPLNARRDTFRVKDRPKLYITEGTVRAKRDLFEAK